jgi:proteasome lid subunit RPN8/RPN11
MMLTVPAALIDEMIAHAKAEAPNECVGMLAGQDGVVTLRFPLVNALASPTRFESEAHSLFEAHKAARAEGIEFLAVYHSHPASPPVPSKHDIADRWGDEVLTIIISLATEPAEVKAWRWMGKRFKEAHFAASPATPLTAPPG